MGLVGEGDNYLLRTSGRVGALRLSRLGLLVPVVSRCTIWMNLSRAGTPILIRCWKWGRKIVIPGAKIRRPPTSSDLAGCSVAVQASYLSA